jgi:nucleoid DNA-binding protein
MAAKKSTAKRAKPVKAKTRRATTAKRATSRKPAVKKAKAPKKASKAMGTKKPAAKTTASIGPVKVSDTFTKTELHTVIAEQTGLSKRDIANVFECLANVVEGHVKKTGPQLFTLPGLLKVKVIRKPATKARKGINPFTGEETTFKAKPARNVVKVQALKKLKEMAL